MKLDDIIIKQAVRRPPRILLHGVHGIGKSSYAATCPNPIFLPTEDGLGEVRLPGGGVPHQFPIPENIDAAFENIGALIKENHKYKTFVIDTVDWLEKIIFRQVCEDKNVKSIADIGWQAGYTLALIHWDRLLDGLTKLREKGMITIMLAHNEIRTFSPPDNETYDRYQIKLHKHAATKLEEWVDFVGFMQYETIVDGEKKKAVGQGERVIFTSERPAYKAKNRYNLPLEIPMTNWNDLAATIKKPNKQEEKYE